MNINLKLHVFLMITLLMGIIKNNTNYTEFQF